MSLCQHRRDELVRRVDNGHFVADKLCFVAWFHNSELVSNATFFEILESFHLVVVAVFEEDTRTTIRNDIRERVQTTVFTGFLFLDARFLVFWFEPVRSVFGTIR